MASRGKILRHGVAGAAVLLAMFATAVLARSTVEVVFPTTHNLGKILAHPALFGSFWYGREQFGPAFRASDDGGYACQAMHGPSLNQFDSKDFEPYIMIAHRGQCSFVQKALNAQNAGASALVLVNSPAKTTAYMGVGLNETELAAQISIPSLMVDWTQGIYLFRWAPSLSESRSLRIMLKASLPVAAPTTSIDVHLFTRVHDPMAVSFKQNFGEAVKALGPSFHFHPHYLISYASGIHSRSNCLNGKYCGSSLDEVKETLRQLCIARLSDESRTMWWKYVALFQKDCVDLHQINEQCSAAVMNKVGVNQVDVVKCVRETSDGKGGNTLLQEQVDDPRHMHYSPLLLVNDTMYESSLSCSSPVNMLSCPPLKFFCMMFTNDHMPDACKTSSSCELGQIVDSCGICRDPKSKEFISNPQLCREHVITQESLAGASARYRILIILLVVVAILAGAVFMWYAHRRRLKMRQEIDRIMAEYTELADEDEVQDDFRSEEKPGIQELSLAA